MYLFKSLQIEEVQNLGNFWKILIRIDKCDN